MLRSGQTVLCLVNDICNILHYSLIDIHLHDFMSYVYQLATSIRVLKVAIEEGTKEIKLSQKSGKASNSVTQNYACSVFHHIKSTKIMRFTA